jgi:acetate kinase
LTEPLVILCLNSGSSSLKYAVFELGEGSERRLREGAVDGIGLPGAAENHAVALGEALDQVGPLAARLGAVGHRIVHGGPDHLGPARIDPRLLARLRALVPLAPLHLPAAIQGIETVAQRRPDLPQVACFDTAFHATLPEVAWRIPLPEDVARKDVRRYGFHGLSYEYALSTLERPIPRRIVIAHLGNGASLAAVREGRSVDTTMGMTPCGGIVMGTRTGDLDPGVLSYVLEQKRVTEGALTELLDRRSGLVAIGGSSDMKALLARREHDPEAKLAVGMFTYAARKAIGAFAAALEGLDLLIFTGGIGEHAPAVRAETCAGLEWMGIKVDPVRNDRGDGVISSEESRVVVRVVTANEELMIARHTRALLFHGEGAGSGQSRRSLAGDPEIH